MKTYKTARDAHDAGVHNAVRIVTHATARAAYRRAIAAAETVPEAHNRIRHDVKTETIDAYITPRARYADAAEIAEAIAGKRTHYLHRHTVNLGTRRWSDYRPEYEEMHEGIIITGTASKTGRSIDRISIAHLIIVQG